MWKSCKSGLGREGEAQGNGIPEADNEKLTGYYKVRSRSTKASCIYIMSTKDLISGIKTGLAGGCEPPWAFAGYRCRLGSNLGDRMPCDTAPPGPPSLPSSGAVTAGKVKS
jgi:hypothetical protein